jgi:hypothetical protein
MIVIFKKMSTTYYLEERMAKSAGKNVLLWTFTISPTITLNH